MKTEKLNNGASGIVPEFKAAVNGNFDALKRAFETAYANGDCGKACMDLAKAVAFSVVGKLVDPQRKTAGTLNKVSNNGLNPVMLDLRRGIAASTTLLDGVRRNSDAATAVTYNDDGDCVTEVADKAAYDAISAIIGDTLTDGMDLVQEAAVALLEQAADHADGPGWLDKPYAVKRLIRHTYVRLSDKITHKDDETTPIQEVYRAVRRVVENSRAVKANPASKYAYIDALDAETMDTVYYRCGKYADIGGYTACGGLYTADAKTVVDIDGIIDSLELTTPQKAVLEMRLRGMSVNDIAKYRGTTPKAVYNILYASQSKAVAKGFIPYGWTDDSGIDTACGVVQVDKDGNIVAKYDSISAASAATGIDKSSISKATKYDGKTQTRKYAGGYGWKLDKPENK